ncbi:ATP-binding protein [Mesobacillus zeae]|uniref:histidine kinase n=1 Tax=Mesobacillus zeae TaxID=1917180 RepID=A0A398AXU3_9BACI|nr:ATP-binding protein [Mesobacillus zeae]RID82462.1 GHKL domain-containing protein [Mesobacillus zeae]
MNSKTEDVLLFEEIKTAKFFLWVFYIILISYDAVYYFVIPYYSNEEIGFPKGGMGIWYYIICFLLLPPALYFLKCGKPYRIKYIYIISFLFLDAINNIMIYWPTKQQFASGHVLELFFVLFTPIFLNKRFFWAVTISYLTKYIFFGLALHTPKAFLPVFVISFLCLIGWVFLTRFQSYIKALLTAYENMRQQEKHVVVGQMATAIAHEIKNPLSSLKGFTQLQQERDSNTDNYYPIMLNEIDRINAIVTDLLILGKPSNAMKRENDLMNIIEYVSSMMALQAEREGVQIEIETRESIPAVVCDDNQIKQVLINLIKNAIEAMPNGGRISVQIVPGTKEVSIRIKDTGKGLCEEQLSKLFDPFFTTKETGTGLGLLVTKKIIEEHQGSISFDSKLGEGTLVVVTLPTGE